MKNVLADGRLTQRGDGCGGGTHRPHMYPTPGNVGGRRVRQGSTSPAPLPLHSTPTQSDAVFAP